MEDDATMDEGAQSEPEESEEDRKRRESIKAIMRDRSLSEVERRRSIQSLMDGRRRSSINRSSVTSQTSRLSSISRGASHGMGMAAAAAAAAAAFDDDSDSDLDDDSNSNAVARRHHSSSTSSVNSMERRGDMDSYRCIAVASAMAQFDDCATNELDLAKRMESSRPECTHYERNCTLISPCCGMAFGCRICHDDQPVLPPPIFETHKEQQNTEPKESARERFARSFSLPVTLENDVPEHHNIDRFAVSEVICRVCFTRQSSKTNACINCNVTFGDYHCSICNLWMSNDEKPYHCDECGFCRVGGRENFKHCFDCGMCIDAFLFSDHNCKVGKYMSNCPVCQEDLFSSRSASHEMPCGHAIHWHCFRELTSFDSRCPVCKKTAESHERMAPTWSAMAMGIALQPVPPDLTRVVTILCNDCESQEENRRWHFLGVQCNECSSFNTIIQETTMIGSEAAVFLGEHESSGESNAVLAAVAASRENGGFGLQMSGDDTYAVEELAINMPDEYRFLTGMQSEVQAIHEEDDDELDSEDEGRMRIT